MDIVFENPHFVAVDKPAGVLTVPGRDADGDTRPCLGRELSASLDVRLWPVHRLDCEVSGLVLFAKTAEAHRAASQWFEHRDVRKTYEALTEGRAEPPPVGETNEWCSRLLRGKKRAYNSPHGKQAVTRAVYVGKDTGRLLWRLQPLTGRPHQLRVHLASRGFPVVGDTLYGATVPFVDGAGIALRAVSLEFAECPSHEDFELPSQLKIGGLTKASGGF